MAIVRTQNKKVFKKTIVVNVNRDKYEKYIGRPTIWGNQFVIGKDGTREEVIKKHYNATRKKALSDPTFRDRMISELDGKTLGCFCKPLDCHGDNYVKLIEEFKAKRRKKNVKNNL